MSVSRVVRAVAMAASVTALALAGSGTAASAAPASATVFRVEVSGLLDMAGLPLLQFRGPVQVTYPAGPVIPPNPIKVATTLVDVVGSDAFGVDTCEARGAETLKLAQAPTDTLTFTETYRLYPPEEIRRQDDVCSGREVGVRYVIDLDDAGQVIGVPTATIACVELFTCNPDTL